jgi:MFS family permease
MSPPTSATDPGPHALLDNPVIKTRQPHPGKASDQGDTGLLANRNFTLLWTGDVLSGLGSQATSVAMPLLVLVDRMDRRRVMIGCAAGRALAMGSLVVMLAVGRPPFWQMLVVAFLNAMLWSVSLIAERGLLPAVVPAQTLSDAVALNEARESVATIGGPARCSSASWLPSCSSRSL